MLQYTFSEELALDISKLIPIANEFCFFFGLFGFLIEAEFPENVIFLHICLPIEGEFALRS